MGRVAPPAPLAAAPTLPLLFLALGVFVAACTSANGSHPSPSAGPRPSALASAEPTSDRHGSLDVTPSRPPASGTATTTAGIGLIWDTVPSFFPWYPARRRPTSTPDP